MDSVFLIGIGGMGMTPLAIYLAKSGVKVYGHDDSELPEITKSLFKRLEIELCKPNDCKNFCNVCVHSSAINLEHTILKEAQQLGFSTHRRGDYLAKILAEKKLLAFVGSHGKTSTTALAIHLLRRAGFKFSYLLGGLFREESILPADYCAESDWVIAELDESDGSINNFSPETTVFLNCDWDHPAFYKREKDYENTFLSLCGRTKSNVILNASLSHLFDQNCAASNFTQFGSGSKFDCEIKQVDGEQWLSLKGEFPKKEYFAPNFFSKENLLAALTAVYKLVGSLADFGAIASFAGVKRRQDTLLNTERISILSDYAHQAKEIDSFLSYAQNNFAGKQWVVFQPHRFSRTEKFKKELASALSKASILSLMPIYAASENCIAGVSSEGIEENLPEGKTTKEFPEAEEVINLAKTDKLIMSFVGAGSIVDQAEQFAAKIISFHEKKLRAGLGKRSLFEKNVDLSSLSYIKIGGKALFYAVPGDENDLLHLLRTCKELGLAKFVMGKASNLLISELRFDGLVIRLDADIWKFEKILSDNLIECGVGISLNRLLNFTERHGIGGFEFLEKIPGTLGGALSMNAGAGKEQISDRLISINLIDKDGIKHTVLKEDCGLAYRKCEILAEGGKFEGAVIVSALMKGETSSAEKIRAKRLLFRDRRKESQPKGLSLGCFFKNPDNDSAGRLIEVCNLKGRKLGGAQVSDIHANFLINDGKASYADVVSLAKYVQKRVFERTEIKLEPEVRILGRQWKNAL